MSNSKIDLTEDNRLVPIREEIAGLSVQQMVEIALVEGPVGDKIAEVLDKYEREIIRLQEANARLRNKNRNYRTGIKSLQRAHEATLHQLAAVKDTSEQYRSVLAEVTAHGGCQISYEDDGDGPYTPVRFNNEAPVSAFESAVAARDSQF